MPTTYRQQRIRTTREQRYLENGVVSLDLPTPDGELNGDSYRVTERQQPGWRSRIKRGDDATTEMSAVRQHWKYQPAYVNVEYTDTRDFLAGYTFVDEMLGDFAPILNLGDTVDVTDAVLKTDQQALVRFINDARKAQSALSGGVVIGELKETLQMLRNPAKKLRQRIDSYHADAKTKFRRFKRTNASGGYRSRQAQKRLLQDTWLEHSFGWSPFVNDIKDAYEAIGDIGDLVDSQFVTGAAKSQEIAAMDLNRPTVNYFNKLSCEYDQNDIYTFTCRYYGRVKLKSVSPEGPRLIRQTFGFDWQDFVPTVWELIPYSFLVDYFTNIGDILSVYSFQEFELKWKSRTTCVVKTREISNFRRLPVTPGHQYQVISSQQTKAPVQSHEYKSLERLRVTWPLIADFRFEIPGLGRKWLNIAALAKLRKF